MNLPKYTLGIGDRFAHQGKAQLTAFVKARQMGVEVAPVWNKSNREHNIVHSEPASVRDEADAAVKALGWDGPYFVDADHIGRQDGRPLHSPRATSSRSTWPISSASPRPRRTSRRSSPATNDTPASLRIPGIEQPLDVATDRIEAIARKYLFAVQEAGRIYRHIAANKGVGRIRDRSFDGRNRPAAIAGRVAVHPRGRWRRKRFRCRRSLRNSPAASTRASITSATSPSSSSEFNDDLAVIAFAIKEFGLPGEPETERPFRQRQVLDLRPDSPARCGNTAPACT